MFRWLIRWWESRLSRLWNPNQVKVGTMMKMLNVKNYRVRQILWQYHFHNPLSFITYLPFIRLEFHEIKSFPFCCLQKELKYQTLSINYRVYINVFYQLGVILSNKIPTKTLPTNPPKTAKKTSHLDLNSNLLTSQSFFHTKLKTKTKKYQKKNKEHPLNQLKKLNKIFIYLHTSNVE